jgi:hypothetical protein
VASEYSVQTCQALAERFRAAGLARPMRIRRYDPGTEIVYRVAGVWPVRQAAVRVRIDQYVGGGFAGQVYRVCVLGVEGQDIPGLEVGEVYALKIMVPSSPRKARFRDGLYRLGFAGPFSLQANPAAVRAGSLWQKFIRRAAALRLGDEGAVADVFATFVDPRLGSCGEIREWVEGRQWRFEVDDRLDARRRWRPGHQPPPGGVGSPEYRAKRTFMRDLVRLMHELGAPELARQYEWWSCMSQTNVLKRPQGEGDAAAGLVAVDFRAGLALLPFLPMSPVDVRLILRGLARGSWVQFDRGDLGRLQGFVEAHGEHFADMRGALEELKGAERQYRDSLPDPTHHGLRLLHDRGLWRGVLDGAVCGWQVRNVTDETVTSSLRKSRLLALVFWALGALRPLGVVCAVVLLGWALAFGRLSGWVMGAAGVLALIVPLTAGLLRRLWGRADFRRHYGKMLTSLDYFRHCLRARRAEILVNWVRSGRVNAARALRLADSGWRFLGHVTLACAPARVHRFLTDRHFAWEAILYLVARPLRLYLDAQARQQWLTDMVRQGLRRGMLTDQEAGRINQQIKEPYIQEYLKNLAVHICLAPTTHVVALVVGIYLAVKYGKTPWEGVGIALATMVFFQAIPVSPGSLARGLYVLYLLVRKRNLRDYNIAVFLAFFKYVGYLAFPVQMAYRYPALARFMASHWATEVTHYVPVFGEHGALLEHGVFDLSDNHLLTLRRRVRLRAESRRGLPPRRWHAALCALAAAGALTGIDLAFLRGSGSVPGLGQTWYLAFWPVLAAGWLAAARAGGLSLPRRVLLAAAAGVLTALLYASTNAALAAVFPPSDPAWPARLGETFLWAALYFALTSLLAAAAAETRPVRD